MVSIRLAAVVLGFAASMAGVLTLAPEIAAQPQIPPQVQQPARPLPVEPLDLFAELMPVFSHPRCVNCHSDMDPNSEARYVDHGGGFVQRGNSCTETCHTDEPDWLRMAPPKFHFKGLDTKAICLMQKQFIKDNSPSLWLSHLSTDSLIGAGFIGLRGGAADVEDKPPMARDEFVEKAANWLLYGAASCGHWQGVITQTETLEDGTYDYPEPNFMPPSNNAVVEKAERVITLERRNGASSVLYNSVGGNSEITRTVYMPLDGGVCKTVYQAKTVWAVQERGPLPAGIDIQIDQTGRYRIRFVLPEETVEQRDNNTMISECLSLPPAPQDPIAPTIWPQWKFLISCPPTFTQDPASGNTIDCDLFDPENMPRLKGTMTRTIRQHEDAAEPQSWLRVSPASGSRLDTGNSIPIKVITTWDFAIVE